MSFDEVLARTRAHHVLDDAAARLEKLAAQPDDVGEMSATAEIVKVDTEQRIVTGWAYQSHDRNGDLVIDLSGDCVPDPSEIEKASHRFVLDSRRADVMHQGRVVARLVESMFVSPDKLEAIGLVEKGAPAPTGWLVTFLVDDDPTWELVKAGKLPMFSIGGTGRRVPAT